MKPVVITITVGEEYPDELRQRLEKYGISIGELSREMGVEHRVLSRIFNAGTSPTMRTVARIEETILKIRAQKEKEKINGSRGKRRGK